eukprot:scaffold10199_cov146-Cylindrotheca_fusiformis.AAC.6
MGDKEGLFVIVSTRDDLLITQELTQLIATECSGCRIVVACPSPCVAATRAWVETVKHEKEKVSLDVLAFSPYGDRNACRSASDQLVKALGSARIRGLVMNWQGCLPGRFGVVLEESGMLEMAQVKILFQVYFLESLIEKKVLTTGSKVVVSGSEAARGIPPLFAAPSVGDSLESFVSVLDGSSLDKSQGYVVYGHVHAILSLYIAALARRNPTIEFWAISPGFTQDSMNKHIQIEANHELPPFSALLEIGMAQDYTIAARSFYNAVTGSLDWKYPSGCLVAAMKGTQGPLCDQSSLEGGAYLRDTTKQDYAYEALHKFV